MDPKSNTQGQGLVSVLVAIGLLGGIALVLAQMFSQSALQQSSLKQATDYTDLVRTFTLVLSQPALCSCNLAPQSGAGHPFTFAAASASSTTFGLGTGFGALKLYDSSCNPGTVLVQATATAAAAQSLWIKKLDLTDFVQVDANQYSAVIHLEVQKTGASSTGFTKDFPVVLNTTTSGVTVTLASCAVGNGPFFTHSQSYDFTSSGAKQPFVVPAGVSTVMVEAWGGGGAGGGAMWSTADHITGGGGGGAAGYYGRAIFGVTVGTSYDVIVGGGGVGGTAGADGVAGGDGTAGEPSSFSLSGTPLLEVVGGGYGTRTYKDPVSMVYVVGSCCGAGSGSMMGCQVTVQGGAGGGGSFDYVDITYAMGGAGGSAGGGGGIGAPANSAGPGTVPGGGGGGGPKFSDSWTARPGYAGANGRVIVWY